MTWNTPEMATVSQNNCSIPPKKPPWHWNTDLLWISDFSNLRSVFLKQNYPLRHSSKSGSHICLCIQQYYWTTFASRHHARLCKGWGRQRKSFPWGVNIFTSFILSWEQLALKEWDKMLVSELERGKWQDTFFDRLTILPWASSVDRT